MRGLTFILELESMTMAELAKELNVSVSILYRWESGKKPIPKERIKQIQKLFPYYPADYIDKEIDDADKLLLKNAQNEHQISTLEDDLANASLDDDDTIRLYELRKKLRNETILNETLIEQEQIINDIYVLFAYTHSINTNSFFDVSTQRLLISHFSDLCSIEKRIVANFIENENNVSAFHDKASEIKEDIKKFCYGLEGSLDYIEKLLKYNNSQKANRDGNPEEL